MNEVLWPQNWSLLGTLFFTHFCWRQWNWRDNTAIQTWKTPLWMITFEYMWSLLRLQSNFDFFQPAAVHKRGNCCFIINLCCTSLSCALNHSDQTLNYSQVPGWLLENRMYRLWFVSGQVHRKCKRLGVYALGCPAELPSTDWGNNISSYRNKHLHLMNGTVFCFIFRLIWEPLELIFSKGLKNFVAVWL